MAGEEGQGFPYYFDESSFEVGLNSENGNIRVLQKFSERSGLPKALDNYRFATLEAIPRTFMILHHSDTHSFLLTTQGKSIITLVHEDHRESFNSNQGDAMIIPGGSNVYVFNPDNNENYKSVILYQPINIPGDLQQFVIAGGQDPPSVYTAFSNELLEAALNVPREKFNRLFGYTSGVFVSASEEQIRELVQDKGQRQGVDSKYAPFNLLQQPPLFSSIFGEFFEATPDTQEQLRELNFSIDIMNIKKGGMIVPHYNTRSIKIVVVIQGKGYFEIVRLVDGGQLQRVSASFSAGDVFIIPVGQPVSIVSSEDEDLQLVSFGINAQSSYKHFFAGGVNIWYQIHPVAKALSFGTQATEVDKVFESQPYSFFVPGPNQFKKNGEEH